MAEFDRDNILDAIKQYYKINDVELEIDEYKIFKPVIENIKEKYPLVKIIPYTTSNELQFQVIYGPFFVCTIKPLLGRMQIDDALKKVSIYRFMDEIVFEFSVGLKRRSEIIKTCFIELPSEFREELVHELKAYRNKYSCLFQYDFSINDKYTFKIINKIKDFEGDEYIDIFNTLMEEALRTILDKIDNNRRYANILEIVKRLEKIYI